MSFSINDIKSQLTFGGARQNLFQVQITNKGNNTADFKVPFMVEAASIPASNLGTIEVPYFGRKLKLAGDRVFDTWAVNIINDEDFLIRNAMEDWSGKINKLQSNVRTLADYKSTAQVTQFSKSGFPIRVYQFIGIFPASVGNIDLNWAANDQIESFPVQFQYDYWTVSGPTGNAGGQG